MSAPTILSAQYTDTQLLIIFNQAIANVSDLDAFTFTQSSGNPFTTTFSGLSQNAVVVETAAAPDSDLEVSYTDPGAGSSQVQSVDGDPAPSFTIQAIEQFPDLDLVSDVIIGRDSNSTITIKFSQPVASTENQPLDGFEVTYDGELLDLSSALAELSSDLRELNIHTGVNASYSTEVVVSYDDSEGSLFTWGDPQGSVDSFSRTALNISTDGLPDSQYPNSLAYRLAVGVGDGVAYPKIEVYLNPIDRRIVRQYGPLMVYTGGAGFGTNSSYPNGINIVGGEVQVVDGTTLSVTVNVPGDSVQAVAAAQDWLDVVTARLAIELGKLRAIDVSVALSGATVAPI